jgi:hypothetical protein
MNADSDALAIALVLAALGLPVFPCGANKRPAIGGPGGHNSAVTDPAAVRALFAKAGDAAQLVGVPMGARSGLDILDIDPRHKGHVWEQANSDRLPETRIHGTLHGGRHYVFRHHPEVRNRAGKKKDAGIAPGVDVRGEGGYAIWPPSAGYSVIHEVDVAKWPKCLLDLARKKPAPVSHRTVVFDPKSISDKRLKGLLGTLLGKIAVAPDGTKHNTLRDIALTIGGYTHLLEIGDDHLVELMIAALPPTAEDIDNARKTALWGLTEGRKQPLDLPDRFMLIDPAEARAPGSGGPRPITREQAKSVARATYTLLQQHRPRDEAWAELQQFAASIGVGPEAARRIARHCIEQHRGGTV